MATPIKTTVHKSIVIIVIFEKLFTHKVRNDFELMCDSLKQWFKFSLQCLSSTTKIIIQERDQSC